MQSTLAKLIYVIVLNAYILAEYCNNINKTKCRFFFTFLQFKVKWSITPTTSGRGANAPLAAQMWALFRNGLLLIRLPLLPKQFYKL